MRSTMTSVWDPVRVGAITRPHRLVLPPHGGGRGSLLGSPEQFEMHCAYWLARVEGGLGWVGGGPGYVRHPVVPGFEAAGVGAHVAGVFRHPRYVERQSELTRRIHDAGGVSTVQLVLQGGLPLAPSPTLSGHLEHAVPHVLDETEIRWLVDEYADSAALAVGSGVDVVELHAGHDDLLQWFLSPRTNRRDDAWGGDRERRRRLLREIVAAIRSRVDCTLGIRLTLDERIDGGYGVDECRALVEAVTADGGTDYVSVDVGSNWGAPSYVPTAVHDDAEWAALAGTVTRATDLPVIYVGRVPDVATAERIVADGHADLVGMVRAAIADPDVVAHAAAGTPERTRPCIVLNDCIDRVAGAGLPFACGVNPDAGHEQLPTPPTAAEKLDVLVVGGGPAGTEFAAQAATRGHRVRLWERDDRLGGQLTVAALARANRRYRLWPAWQEARLDRLGVEVVTGFTAGEDDVLAAGANVVAIATGARPRVPDAVAPSVVVTPSAGPDTVAMAGAGARPAAAAMPRHTDAIPNAPGSGPPGGASGDATAAGMDATATGRPEDAAGAPSVVQAVDVLAGRTVPGRRVLVVAEDDRGVPLVVADHLAGAGHDVTLVHSSPTPSPGLSRYSNGSLLARLDRDGVVLRAMTRLVGVEPGGARVAHVYSGREHRLSDVDTVVLACGAVPDDGLFRSLRERHPRVHVLGDAYAPRQVAFATRQAWALARDLDNVAAARVGTTP